MWFVDFLPRKLSNYFRTALFSVGPLIVGVNMWRSNETQRKILANETRTGQRRVAFITLQIPSLSLPLVYLAVWY